MLHKLTCKTDWMIIFQLKKIKILIKFIIAKQSNNKVNKTAKLCKIIYNNYNSM